MSENLKTTEFYLNKNDLFKAAGPLVDCDFIHPVYGDTFRSIVENVPALDAMQIMKQAFGDNASVTVWRDAEKDPPEKSRKVVLTISDLGLLQLLSYSSKHGAFNCNDDQHPEVAKVLMIKPAYWMDIPEIPLDCLEVEKEWYM